MPDVDSRHENGQKPDADSRACARARVRNPELDALALEIETDTRLGPDASVRDIILAKPSIRKQLVAAAVRCLAAEKWYYSKTEDRHIYEPDFVTQLRAVAWIASYSDGLPVQTNLNLNANANGNGKTAPLDDLMSPAAIEATERWLARAKAKQAESKAPKLVSKPV